MITFFKQRQLKQRLSQYHDDYFAWALQCCLSQTTLAEDVLQMVYVKVLDGSAQYQGRSDFKSWLFSVIKYTAIDELRKQQRFTQVPTLALEAVCTEQNPSENGALGRQFQRLLGQLSSRQQDVLHLVFFQELSIEAAAQVLQISTGSARTHYRRGKAQLAKLITSSKLEYHDHY